jgi:hypothetical protein
MKTKKPLSFIPKKTWISPAMTVMEIKVIHDLLAPLGS